MRRISTRFASVESSFKSRYRTSALCGCLGGSLGDDVGEMMFKPYQRPHLVGWLGWFEDENGNAIGFLGLDNVFVFHNACGVKS